MVIGCGGDWLLGWWLVVEVVIVIVIGRRVLWLSLSWSVSSGGRVGLGGGRVGLGGGRVGLGGGRLVEVPYFSYLGGRK